jgi:hypothetical protein
MNLPPKPEAWIRGGLDRQIGAWVCHLPRNPGYPYRSFCGFFGSSLQSGPLTDEDRACLHCIKTITKTLNPRQRELLREVCRTGPWGPTLAGLADAVLISKVVAHRELLALRGGGLIEMQQCQKECAQAIWQPTSLGYDVDNALGQKPGANST